VKKLRLIVPVYNDGPSFGMLLRELDNAAASLPFQMFLSAIDDSTLRHLPTLVVPERRVFVPTVFSVVARQPLRVLRPWSEIAVPNSRVPDVHVLDSVDQNSLIAPALVTDPT
jgi:hypothetical protein